MSTPEPPRHEGQAAMSTTSFDAAQFALRAAIEMREIQARIYIADGGPNFDTNPLWTSFLFADRRADEAFDRLYEAAPGANFCYGCSGAGVSGCPVCSGSGLMPAAAEA